MRITQHSALFIRQRKSLTAAGLCTTSGDSLICPLCWQETHISELSIEHVLPRSVGGRTKILTCRRCNNSQGSTLDAHLSQFQTIADAFRGHGDLRTVLTINGKQLATNLRWGDTSKDFHVVKKAIDPSVEALIKDEFRSGAVKTIKARMSFGYSKNRFQTAVLRAAYLVLFGRFGYGYARHEIVQAVRRRVCDPSLEFPQIASLIVGLGSWPLQDDAPYAAVCCNVNGIHCFVVILKIQKKTSSYLAAFMPSPVHGCEEFFELMKQCYEEHKGKSLPISFGDVIA